MQRLLNGARVKSSLVLYNLSQRIERLLFTGFGIRNLANDWNKFHSQGIRGAIHSTKIPTGPTGKSGPPQKVDPFFRNFSGWTEPIH